MHANFDGFPWTKEDISEDFGGCGGGEVECGTVFMGGFFTDEIGVLLLEQLVEPVFTGA